MARVLSKMAMFDKIGYTPHIGQRAIHRSTARHRVVAAGRRFGKSRLSGCELYCEAVATRYMLPELEESDTRREYWIVGPEYSDSEKEFRVVYNALRKRGAPFDKPGTYNNPHDGDMQISLYNGRFLILGKSAKHPERLVGEGLHGVVMAEAAKMPERVWSKFIRPTLADYNGWSLWDSTPEGKNWYYKIWNQGQAEDYPEWESWRRSSWHNPHVYPLGVDPEALARLKNALKQRARITPELLEGIDPEIAAMAMELAPEEFSQEIEANFSQYAGRVFGDFDDEIHVRDITYNPAWPVYAAVDYGFTNPFVWLLIQVDPWGAVYVIDEMYESGLTIDEIALELDARGLVPEALRVMYPDPASPGDSKLISRKFRLRVAGGTGGELSDRLRLIRAALRVRNLHLPFDDPERKPKLFIARRCTNTIREMDAYRYPKTAREVEKSNRNAPELPLKKDDHTPEALGRFFIGHFGTGSATGVRVTAADMG